MRRVTDQKSTTRMPGTDQQMYEARLLRVLSYIYDHLDGDLSLDAGPTWRAMPVACLASGWCAQRCARP
jgi:hypothetical protein